MSSDYSYNRNYLMKDGKPWFPVMGEMHFTRFRNDMWEDSLRKMKSGGVEIVSTYMIWIHHEEEQGVFDFSGNKDLRKYLETCKKVGIKVLLRLGPWVHGEARNGGFPDWVCDLSKDGVDLRSDDEKYLFYVRRYWQKVSELAAGMMDKDGGPIIGFQIENEYGHVGGYTGEKGETHMRTLTAMAKELGFVAQIYTATGWGGAVIGDCLPVMGGYCDAPWDSSLVEMPANGNFVMSHNRNDALIACDHEMEDNLTFNEADYPYLTAELGGGLQVTGHRRPVAEGKDIGGMSITKLASGANLLGYYMYHGGTNPYGKFTTLQESKATGYPNDLPEYNYDFNAPIRQYGTISDTYKELKIQAMFLQEFGSDIAPLPSEILNENISAEDVHSLRIAVRHDDEHGYVFVNNYQRHRTMDAHKAVELEGITKNGKVLFPEVDIESGEYFFYPYNMQINDAVLEYATATPFCTVNGILVLYGDKELKLSWKDDKEVPYIYISREDALNAYKVVLDKEYLVIADNFVYEKDGKLVVVGEANTSIKSFPELPDNVACCFANSGVKDQFCLYERDLSEGGTTASLSLISENEEEAEYEIDINYPQGGLNGGDAFVNIDYTGMSLDIYLNGVKINDHFYTGQKVPVSMKYFDYPEKIIVKVKPLFNDAPVYLEDFAMISEERACRINSIDVNELF